MAGEKALLTAIEADFAVMKQLLDSTRDSVYVDGHGMSSAVQELYRQAESNLRILKSYVRADLIGKMNRLDTD
jgi:hypothetical protein